MQVKSIAECSKGSILPYFGPSLSYHIPLKPLFCQILSGPLRPVLLYKYFVAYCKAWTGLGPILKIVGQWTSRPPSGTFKTFRNL